MTRQLLAFSRKQVLQPRVLDLNAVVTDVEKLCRRVIGENIELTTSLDARIGRVRADPGQLEQVLVNLVVNARDAMPEGGKLTVATGEKDYSASTPLFQGEPAPERYVALTVTDTGCGMTEETRARIFEPFFTTKEKGKGTGLGLATVYGIVSQSGGQITVDSQLGRGTAFQVLLPRVDEEPSAIAPSSQPARPLGRAAVVLLVEDDPGVRSLAQSALERAGCRVLLAPNGNEALTTVISERPAIDLLLTDIVMPGISGKELWKRLEPYCPGLRVLFMSGYIDDGILEHHVLDAETALLPKPFSPQSLIDKVQLVLMMGTHT